MQVIDETSDRFNRNKKKMKEKLLRHPGRPQPQTGEVSASDGGPGTRIDINCNCSGILTHSYRIY